MVCQFRLEGSARQEVYAMSTISLTGRVSCGSIVFLDDVLTIELPLETAVRMMELGTPVLRVCPRCRVLLDAAADRCHNCNEYLDVVSD